MRISGRRVLCGLLVLFLGGVLNACRPRPGVPLRVGGFKIQAEVAATELQQETGLMFRTHMDENDGMIFVFPESARKAFWMRNTYLPLTVAFLDDQGVVLNLEDMQPQTENPHWSSGPAKYALEMNQGWFAKRGIAPGAKMEGLDRLSPTSTPIP